MAKFKNLEAEMVRCGLKNEDLAEKLAITPQTIRRKLNGEIAFFAGQMKAQNEFFETTEDKERFKIANDCDRRGLTSEEIKSIATCMAKNMSDEKLMSSIQQLERFWTIKAPRVLKQNNRVITPEEGFAIGLIEEARNRHLEFNVDGQKVVAVDPYSWRKIFIT